MVTNLQKINSTIFNSLAYGEDFFYNRVVENLKTFTKSNCFIIKSQSPKSSSKVYPVADQKKQKILLASFSQRNILKLAILQSDVRLNKSIHHKLISSGFVDENNELGSRVIIKAIKSLNNQQKLSAIIIIERKPSQPDFSDEEIELIEHFHNLMIMASEVLGAEGKIKALARVNSNLKDLVSLSFPNNPKEITGKKLVSTSYLALDIRKSCDLNEYLLAKGELPLLLDFYSHFKTVCDKITLKKYSVWFRKQIGDGIDYAWQGKTAKLNSVLAALELYEEIKKLRIKYKLPASFDLGIGIAYGKTKPDFDIKELKGDTPRIAKTLQEGKAGIYLDFPIKDADLEIITKKGYQLIPREVVVRDALKQAWEIRKQTPEPVDIFAEDTATQLKFANRLYGDHHTHVEGAHLTKFANLEVFQEAAKFVNRNLSIKKEYESITKRSLVEVVSNYVTHVKNNKLEPFSFDVFLTKLYCSKLILASKPELTEKFLTQVVEEYFKKFWFLRLGLTTSIPVDFAHLDAKEWNDSVYQGLNHVLRKDSDRRLELVIETKRQHLVEKQNGQFKYENNLAFIKQLKAKRNPKIKFSASLCDDGSINPFFVKKYSANYRKYLTKLQAIGNVSFSFHMLETAPNLDYVDDELKQKVIQDSTYEFEYVLNLFAELKIFGVTWIHMGHLFSDLNPHASRENKTAQLKISRGLNYLEKIIERGDKIVICLSSNQYLFNPFLLSYPEFIKVMLEGKLDVVLGTDDPEPFKTKDIAAELEKVVEYIKKQYPKGLAISENEFYSPSELARLVKFVLIRNSWRKWSKEKRDWVEENIEQIGKKLGFDQVTFSKALNYDICPTIDCLEDSNIRRKIIQREKESWYNRE